MAKKFKNDEEFYTEVHRIEWTSRMSTTRHWEELEKELSASPFKTDDLRDALFLLRMAKEKVEKHNGICAQTAGKMRQISYKRNNIEGY